jgi:hypothetical protein
VNAAGYEANSHTTLTQLSHNSHTTLTQLSHNSHTHIRTFNLSFVVLRESRFSPLP